MTSMRYVSVTGYLIKMLLALAISLLPACENSGEIETIRAISLLPRQTNYTRDFEAWIEELNQLGQGKFRIIFVGGPEAIPTFEQADAIRTGVVHLLFGPATYYMGLVPEVEALFASNMSPQETRANGGLALLDEIHQQDLGSRYLARTMFIEFHIFTREPPPIDNDGLPDLSQHHVRGGPVWRDFITSLGANYVNVAAPDIYMALERNMIQGLSWPIVGLTDASWHQHLKYRIDPGVFSSDVGIIFNSDKWDSLSEETRDILNRAAIKYEAESFQRFQAMTMDLDRKLREQGLQVLHLDEKGEARYRKLANDVIWKRLKQRSPEYYDRLRASFYRDSNTIED